jgi:hypothetical protein
MRSSAEAKVFGALVVLVGAIVVAFIGLESYLHPPGPKQVGTATIAILGEGRFSGVVGTSGTHYTIEATSPATVKVPYSLADYVIADVAALGSLDRDRPPRMEIRVKNKTVEKGANTMLVWKPPR